MAKYFASPIMHRIYRRMHRLYGGPRAPRLVERLAMLVNRYGVGAKVQRPAGLWTELDAVLITYGDTIVEPGARPLATLRGFLKERLQGAVSAVHLLPFFPYSSDDGFAITVYREVRPELGGWKDVEAIASEFRLMADLVLNHCSRASSWFRDYTSGILPERGYFIEVPPNTDLSSVVRPRTSPLLTEVITRDGKRHVWTTFSADQIDLDFANPDVLFEFLDILFFYISKGARMIRLDAVAYLWKKIGSPCIHLPEAHEVVKLMRDLLELVAPDAVIVTETNVPHEENISYFGDGDEAHMVYQFSLPPLVLHALLRGTGKRLTAWAKALAPPRPGCTFLNFTASHDGVGVRPLEGLVPDDELKELIAAVKRRGGRVSSRKNSDGTESPYELNVSWFSAMADPENPNADLHVARFLCSQAIPLALRGVPAVYIHSLLATENDLEGVKRTGRARSINRKQWKKEALDPLLADPASPAARVFEGCTRLLRVRANYAAFHPDGDQEILDFGDELFVVKRTSPDKSQTVVAFHNLAAKSLDIDLSKRSDVFGTGDKWRNVVTGRKRGKARGILSLAPYDVCWLQVSS